MLEPEMQAFLLRLVPGLDRIWRGASDEEIAAIEEIAGQELPRFYRWFLSTMGRSAGPLDPPLGAYAARRVLAAYEAGEVDAEPPMLLLARMDDPMAPLEVYYDLGRTTRNDAFVVHAVGEELTDAAETLRERLAWSLLIKLRVNTSPQWCRGVFTAPGGSASDELAPALAKLGFVIPVATGRYCGVYERPDAALACRVDAEADNLDTLVFKFGGPDVVTLRSVLGQVAVMTGLEVSINTWNPPLTRR